MANSVDPDQTAPIGAVCSGSTLFASILNSSVMLGNYLQLTTSADDIFRCIFSWRFKGQAIFMMLFLKPQHKARTRKKQNNCIRMDSNGKHFG